MASTASTDKRLQATAFRNLIARGSKDQGRQLQLIKLAGAFEAVPKPEREAFIKNFYANCGAKGDMAAFCEQVMCVKTQQKTSSKEGWFTPGQVADDLKLQRATFESVGVYQAALEEVISRNQDEHGVPAEGRVIKGSTFWTSKFFYTTTEMQENAHLNEQSTTMKKTLETEAGRRAKSMVDGTQHLFIGESDVKDEHAAGSSAQDDGRDAKIMLQQQQQQQQQQLRSKQTQAGKKKQAFMRTIQQCRFELLKKKEA
eukprot:4374686-Amphidinium_carterae.1